MEKIKLVVINENTLGYIKPNQTDRYYVIHASILKGATFEMYPNDKLIHKSDKIRLANQKDFADYRVSMKGFDNKRFYEFDEN